MTGQLTSEDIEILRDLRKATPCAAYGFESDELAHLLDAGLIQETDNCWATTPTGELAIAAYEEAREAQGRHGFLYESDADFRWRYDFARSIMLDGHQLGALSAEVKSALDDMFNALDRGLSMTDFLRQIERSNGYEVIVPGERPWLSSADWDRDIVVSLDEKEVRLVTLLAKKPGNGALRRTVDGIIEDGLVPVICAPLDHMEHILKRWRWKCKISGTGFHLKEEWRPRSDFKCKSA